MKKKFIIRSLAVPNYVFVDMHNGEDYIKIPIQNLDNKEVHELLATFIDEFVDKAGYEWSGEITIIEPEF